MNCRKWLVVMCVCLGLATGSYLVGCGDDDDDVAVDEYNCDVAAAEFLSEACQNEADAAAADLDACAALCTTETCVEACLDVFIAASPSCTKAADKLFGLDSGCTCAAAAGDVFFACIEAGTLDASVCVNDLQTGVEACNAVP